MHYIIKQIICHYLSPDFTDLFFSDRFISSIHFCVNLAFEVVFVPSLKMLLQIVLSATVKTPLYNKLLYYMSYGKSVIS